MIFGVLGPKASGTKSLTASYPAFGYREGFTAYATLCTNIEYPSAGALFTYCVAILPPAPGLFSTTKFPPVVLASSCPTIRAITSVNAPGANAT